MAKKQKLEAELGIDNKPFVDGLSQAEDSLGSFGKELGLITAAIGAAAGAMKIMLDWFNSTEAGADMMNSTLRVSQQLLTDVMMGRGLNIDNVRESLSIAEQENKIRIGNLRDNLMIAKLEKETRNYRIEAYDVSKSLTERIEAQTKALAKQRELEAYKLADIKEELEAVERRLKLNPIDTKALQERNRLQVEYINAQDKESLRVISQLNQLIAQQRERADALVEAFTPIPPIVESAAEQAARLAKELEDAKKAAIEISRVELNQGPLTGRYFNQSVRGGGMARGGADLAGAPQIEIATGALTEQQEALMDLSYAWSGFFADIDEGFKGIIENIIKGIERMIAQMVANWVFMKILSMITGVPMPGMKNFLPSGIGNATQSGAFGAFGQGLLASNVGQESLVTSLKGKDIQIALMRG